MNFLTPEYLAYAGLVGVLLALFVGFATNQWQLRVLFLLALRLAIGWHFLFEGVQKIHSHLVGPTETNRPFTSEPYFAAAEGPFGEMMRKKYLGDTEAEIAARIAPRADIAPADFAKLSQAEQASHCPEPVAQELSAAWTDPAQAEAAKAAYARWVYGVDPRDATVKFVNGPVPLTVPDRLAVINLQQKRVDELAARSALGLGQGYGHEQKLATEARADLRTSRAALLADANQFVKELKAQAPSETAEAEPAGWMTRRSEDVQWLFGTMAGMDKITMWMITLVGACLLLGLFTRTACLVGAAFLLLTYLTHPPFPWLPLPPGTEGNPIFVNKNVIEMLALLVIAVHPTGRWLGLDALLGRICCCPKARA
jgi:uncharacterized membrane protein YphA (DoxX/SURF4 family)